MDDNIPDPLPPDIFNLPLVAPNRRDYFAHIIHHDVRVELRDPHEMIDGRTGGLVYACLVFSDPGDTFGVLPIYMVRVCMNNPSFRPLAYVAYPGVVEDAVRIYDPDFWRQLRNIELRRPVDIPTIDLEEHYLPNIPLPLELRTSRDALEAIRMWHPMELGMNPISREFCYARSRN